MMLVVFVGWRWRWWWKIRLALWYDGMYVTLNLKWNWNHINEKFAFDGWNSFFSLLFFNYCCSKNWSKRYLTKYETRVYMAIFIISKPNQTNVSIFFLSLSCSSIEIINNFLKLIFYGPLLQQLALDAIPRTVQSVYNSRRP